MQAALQSGLPGFRHAYKTSTPSARCCRTCPSLHQQLRQPEVTQLQHLAEGCVLASTVSPADVGGGPECQQALCDVQRRGRLQRAAHGCLQRL